MTEPYTPTTGDISRAWLLHRLSDPTMKHDPDSSDAEDEFQRWLEKLKRSMWADSLRDRADRLYPHTT